MPQLTLARLKRAVKCSSIDVIKTVCATLYVVTADLKYNSSKSCTVNFSFSLLYQVLVTVKSATNIVLTPILLNFYMNKKGPII